ncbi:hypothetical protein Sjap_010757 [Stephania japonica]|uniref:FAS1 domain-containing protein n=1 Tax=Stephania japonica TaxID=461633 RepID=A0AAP0P6R7_9MAGN
MTKTIVTDRAGLGYDLNKSTITIFSSTDDAFLASHFTQPPMSLLEYHVVPRKVEEEDLESLIPAGFKLDTLLYGHSLHVTSSRNTSSLNDVKIKEWDVYNDGHVLVRGVNEFFNPSFKTRHFDFFRFLRKFVLREALETLIPFGSKLDTLRHGHPLVVTTVGHANASVNNVLIKDWDMFNNGKFVFHGVHRFFDPTFQTAEFPWLSSSPISNNGTKNTTSSSNGPETNASSPISSNGTENNTVGPMSSNGIENNISSGSASKRDNTSATNWASTWVVILAVLLVVFCAVLVRALTQKFLVSKVEVNTSQKVFHSDSKCKDPNVVYMVPLKEIFISKV